MKMADAGAFSFLAPEVAEYFKLDVSELGLFGRSRSELQASRGVASLRQVRGQGRLTRAHTGRRFEPQKTMVGPKSKTSASRPRSESCGRSASCGQLAGVGAQAREPTGGPQRLTTSRKHSEEPRADRGRSAGALGAAAQLDRLVSSTSSTSSLPSISSSPSVSPSLVCPHLSLDDLLAAPQSSHLGAISPHTIGLCPKCRLEAPPNIQSPLSPHFSPASAASRAAPDCAARPGARAESMSALGGQPPDAGADLATGPSCEAARLVRRAHSDQQATSYSRRCRQVAASQRDDSLDHYLEPGEARRLQLSPSVRHSVGFIRTNCIQSGRVVRIFRNGQPFDRPLRVCIRRGEFATLTHLLDHINSRQLVASGARYLFHLDGQLVYSVNELKHGSIYVVSGTRAFAHSANSLLRQQQRRELQARLAREQPAQRAGLGGARPGPTQAVRPILRTSRAAGAPKSSCAGQPAGPAAASSASTGGVGGPHCRTSDHLLAVELPPQQHMDGARRLTRAKSELAAAPSRRKKNVTFVDTGRGSSPAISSCSEPRPAEEELGHESGDVQAPRPGPDLGHQQVPSSATSEIGIQVSDSIDGFLIDLPIAMPAKNDDSSLANATGPRPASQQQVRSRGFAGGKRAQAATTPSSKRAKGAAQTDSDRRRIVTIIERQLSSDELKQLRDMDEGDHHHESGEPAGEASVPQLTVDLDPTSPESGSDHDNEGAGSATVAADGQVATRWAPEADRPKPVDGQPAGLEREDPWQYPGGRTASATPTQRPVSQNGPSESVRARVSTPTPPIVAGAERTAPSASRERKPQPGGQATTPKRRPPLVGKPSHGLDMPGSNFELLWVNGFAINEQCADSVGPAGAGSNEQQLGPAGFEPAERFQNWLSYSARHDELVYPAGALVVLWCRRTDEQRHYASHSASVSALTLSSVDPELAASAQLADPSGRWGASVHLWSLASLATLLVVDGDQFRAKRIVSLRLKGGRRSGCELAVSARDDKQVWLYAIGCRLAAEPPAAPATGARPPLVLGASRVLQAKQAPLLVLALSGAPEPAEPPAPQAAGPQSAPPKLSSRYILSFGRRHFHLWLVDAKQPKLRPLRADHRGAQLGEMLGRATCLARLAPNELLLGDSAGRLGLLLLGPPTGPAARRRTTNGAELSCSVELVSLVDLAGAAITCVARVSGNLFCSADSSCAIKFWRVGRPDAAGKPSCRELASLRLPGDLGVACAIVPASYDRGRATVDFYIAATSNSILFCSLGLEQGGQLAQLSVVYEGHQTAASSLVADAAPAERLYFTCSLDSRICKWAGKLLVWKSLLPSPCASIAIHPVGCVLAVGSTDGTVYILDKLTGLLESYLPLTPVCINCLAYSRDGLLLAAGCSNGSIFILPVDRQGAKYRKVSVFQSPHAVVSLQFSVDNRYVLTSVTRGPYQELILWDLPNFRYMRDNVKLAAGRIQWHDSICSGSEDVRATWENANLAGPLVSARGPARQQPSRPATVVNLSCHRLVRAGAASGQQSQDFVIAGDANGYLRLFRYPAHDIQQGFYALRISSTAVNCCRFINSLQEANFVSTSIDGSICLWKLRPDPSSAEEQPPD